MQFEAWNKALGYVQSGQFQDACQICRTILAAQPNNAQVLKLLASLLIRLESYQELAKTLQKIAELEPSPDVHFNLGSAYAFLNHWESAVASFAHAIQLDADRPEFYLASGRALRAIGRLDDSIKMLLEAIRKSPDSSLAYSNLGESFSAKEMHKEAIASFEAAILRDPNATSAFQNLAWSYHFDGQYEKSLSAAKRATLLDPNSEMSQTYLGNAFADLGDLNNAVQCYERAIQLNAHCALAHSNLGKTLLRQGDFERGWREYEWRWQAEGVTPPEKRFAKPVWNGSDPNRKTVLLYGEQGFGDQIHFFRYACVVKSLGARVVVQVHPRLIRLLKSGSGFDAIIGRNDPPPDFDVQASLMSVPTILHSTLETIPSEHSYLFAEPALVQKWQNRLDGRDGLRVGIAWQGSPAFKGDRFRSFPLSQFRTLMDVERVRVISLQVGHGKDQLATCDFADRIEDYSSELDIGNDAFVDTAALIKNLDLVISCDSAVGHLSGALGVPTWLLLNHDAEWRWFIDRDDSPWYPSVRLFRQTRLMDWGTVFAKVRDALRSFGN
ncbi:MAG: tetratricopeptide repeat protein [Pirellula sp.]